MREEIEEGCLKEKEHKNGSTRVRTGDPHYVKVM